MVYQGGGEHGGCRVYVGNLDYAVRHDDIHDLFADFGQLREVHIKQGFAFIDYAQPESAQDAIREMHGKRFFGRILKVQVAGEGTSSRGLDGRGERVVMHAGRSACSSLFVANIEASITEGELSAHFAKFGRVVTVKLLPRKAETLSAFVDFERVEDAATAHESKNVLRDLVLRTDYSTRDRGPLPNSHRFDDRPPRPPAHYYDDHGYMPGPPLRHDDRRPSYYGRYDERDRQYDRRTDYPHPAYGRHDARRFEYGPPPGYERDVPLRRYDGYDGYDRAPPMRERDYYDERRYHDVSREPARSDYRYERSGYRQGYDDRCSPYGISSYGGGGFDRHLQSGGEYDDQARRPMPSRGPERGPGGYGTSDSSGGYRGDGYSRGPNGYANGGYDDRPYSHGAPGRMR